MIILQGYDRLEKIHSGSETLILRGLREFDNLPVVIKTPAAEHPEIELLARLRRDYEMRAELNLRGIIKAFTFETYGESAALVMEDMHGESLSALLRRHLPGIPGFLKFSVQLCDIIAEMHDRGIMHCALHPANIIINERDELLKLTDFAAALPLASYRQDWRPLPRLEAPIGSMAPEQTGRTNLRLDYRADLFALGACLYAILTGTLPYENENLAEGIQQLLSAPPPDPRDYNIQIPATIVEIVLSLLSQAPEERYRSARAVRQDIEKCQQQLREQEVIGVFPLGRSAENRTEQLFLSRRLFNKQEAGELLQNELRAVLTDGNTRVFHVSGISGAGKHRLVDEMLLPAALHNAICVRVRSNPMDQAIPLRALNRMLRDLIEFLLTGDEEERSVIRELLNQHTGNGLQLLIDSLPVLEELVGPQPPVTEVPGHQNRNRLCHVIAEFCGAIAGKFRPLVLILENAECADRASMEILREMLPDLRGRCLLILTENVPEAQPPADCVEKLLERARSAGLVVTAPRIEPISYAETNAFIQESFQCDAGAAEGLGKLLFEKTRGEFFFTVEAIRELRRKNIIRIDRQQGWHWNYNSVKVHGLSDDSVGLFKNILLELNQETQDALKTAACLGLEFDVRILAAALRLEPTELIPALQTALRLDLIYDLDVSARYYRLNDAAIMQRLLDNDVSGRMAFAHESIRLAAYNLIEAGEQSVVHLEIGRALLSASAEADREDLIYETVFHYMLGRDLVTIPGEKTELARLSLQAARRAWSETDTHQAGAIVERALPLLTDDGWDREMSLTRGLNEMAVLCALQNETDIGPEQKEKFDLLLRRSSNHAEKARLYETLIYHYIDAGHFKQALDIGREALRALGQRTPARFTIQSAIFREIVKSRLSGRTPDAQPHVNDMAEMSDPEKLSILRIIHALLPAALFADIELLMVLGMTGANMSVRNGLSRYSALCFGVYAFVHHRMRDYAAGAGVGELMQAAAQRFDDWNARALTRYFYAAYILPVQKPLSASAELLHSARELSMQAGNVRFAVYSVCLSISYAFFSGMELNKIVSLFKNDRDFVRNHGDSDALRLWNFASRTLMNLRDRSETEGHGDPICAENTLQQIEREGHMLVAVVYLSYRLLLALVYREFEAAYAVLRRWQERTADFVTSRFEEGLLLAFEVVILARVHAEQPEKEQKALVKRMQAALKRLQPLAQHCPDNFQALYLFALAESAGVQGAVQEAMLKYRDAREAARKHRLMHLEAIIAEYGGRFYRENNFGDTARLYLREARDAYVAWGATARVAVLDKEFADDLGGATEQPEETMAEVAAESIPPEEAESLQGMRGSAGSDLESVLQSSRLLAQEVHPVELHRKLILLAIRHSSAPRVFLVIRRHNRLYIDARGLVDTGEIQTGLQIPLESSEDLSANIVQYTLKAKQAVHLNDAAYEGVFKEDPYVIKYSPRSILALPLMIEEEVRGILYLENNMTIAAFTPEITQAMKILSSQIAISMENADRFQNLQQKVEEQQRALEREQHQSRQYLHNVMPAVIADQYLERGRVVASLYRRVSVLAVEFDSFAHYTEKMEAHRLVSELGERYSYFQKLADMHSMYRIRFAGPAGLYAGGFPQPGAAHAVDACQTALVMRLYLQKLEKFRLNAFEYGQWNARFGVQSAGVMAGVIAHGDNGFGYDMWGPAVDMAEFLRDTAEPGQILITAETQRLVESYFETEAGPMLQWAGKELRTYLLKGIRRNLAADADAAIPNDDYLERYRRLKETRQPV